MRCPRCSGNLIPERDELYTGGFTCLQCDREFELVPVRREPTLEEQDMKGNKEPRLPKYKENEDNG